MVLILPSIVVVLGVVLFLIGLLFLMWGWNLDHMLAVDGPHVATLVGIVIFAFCCYGTYTLWGWALSFGA